jgi:hypothetical protein
MFWYLLLAHFLGDYPLQSNWMVANRGLPQVRLLHGAIHFGMMLLLTIPASVRVWPFFLLLTAVHLAIDISKSWSTNRLPDWTPGMYVVDQAVHYLSIGLIATWIERYVDVGNLLISRTVVLYGTGFLLATYIWLISERIIFAGHPAATELGVKAWPRLWIRGGLLALILFGWQTLFPVAMGLAFQMPYPATRGGARALLIDVLVTLGAAGLVIAVSGVK